MRFIKECFTRPPEEGKGPWPHRAAEPWRSMNKVGDREGVDELFQAGETCAANGCTAVESAAACAMAASAAGREFYGSVDFLDDPVRDRGPNEEPLPPP